MNKLFNYTIIFALILIACKKNSNDVNNPKLMELKTIEDSLSYFLGMQNAQKINMDSLPINKEAFVNGFLLNFGKDSLVGISLEASNNIWRKYFDSISKSVHGEKIKNDGLFLKELSQKDDVVTLPSGMRYKILEAGTSSVSINNNSNIIFNFNIKLADGKIIDDTFGGKAVEYPYNRLEMPAWLEILPKMKKGAKYMLWIPYQLAFGEAGVKDVIPPYSLIISEIQLVDVINK